MIREYLNNYLPLESDLMRQRLSIALCLLMFHALTARGSVWYCDPVNGSTPANAKDVGKGDGSKEKPWGTLQSIVPGLTKGPVRSGDTIRLLNGVHGSVPMTAPALIDITIEAEKGQKPILNKFVGMSVTNWTFRNLLFRPTDPLPQYSILFRVNASAGITVDGCDLRSCDDISDQTDDWATKVPFYGIHINGTGCKVINNTVYACTVGMALMGDDLVVSDNVIECFTNDGMSVSASNIVITRNRIVDQYQIPGSTGHNDAIQLFDLTTTVRENVTISDNYIARSTGKYKSIPPVVKSQTGTMQGICQFDGIWKNIRVTNNIVMLTAYHGITLFGTEDSVISNNTVISQSEVSARICFGNSKAGKQTTNALCENNIAHVYVMPLDGVTLKNNFCFDNPHPIWNAPGCKQISPAKTFVLYDRDHAKFDLNIRRGSPAADKKLDVPGAGARR